MGFARRSTQPDPDPVTTQEWRDSIRAVAEQWGEEEARRLLHATVDAAKDAGVDIEVVETPYLNTIHPDDQGTYPGDLAMEERLHGIIRWNAMMMVTGQTSTSTALAATSPPMLPPPTLGRSASTTSSEARTTVRPATTCTGRVTPPRASTPVLGLKAD